MLLGLPWSILLFCFDFFNIFYNFSVNHYWAYGNLFLIANTIIQLVQGLNSLLVIIELPLWLKNFKFLRALSLIGAIGYVTFYSWCFLEWIWNMFSHPEMDLAGLLFNLFFSWHVVFHAPVMLTNLAIIVKELLYERYHVVRKKHGVTRD